MTKHEVDVKIVNRSKLSGTTFLTNPQDPLPTSKVYVPQIPMVFNKEQYRTVPKFDTLRHAREFGELVVLLDRNSDVWDPNSCMDKLRLGLKDFSESDFLLPMGSHHFMMWSAIVIAQLGIRRLQTLQWHSRNNEYIVLVTSL